MATLSLPLLVPPAWLADHLDDTGLVVLDASWYLPVAGRNARAEYVAGHIPGAVFFDLDGSSDASSTLPHTLPGPEQFSRFAGELGVGPESRVVVYDGSGTNISAARAWWMFRHFGHRAVALLDGGIARWRSEGRALETGDVKPVLVDFVATGGTLGISNRGEVEAALGEATAQVVDMRSAGRFRGKEPEPRPGLPSGHMAGAINLPFNELVHTDGTALSPDELKARITAAGVRLDRPIIATCGSGTSACTLLHALARLGYESGSL
jgi:thiosulfate/3-mercaptopyruvate sulfurtransferase